jgi:RNA recognition motif-containing protein
MTNIYVGNLAQRVTEDEIRQAFGRFGQVGKIRIVFDHETNRSLGYAFVEMASPIDARAAIDAMSKPVAPCYRWNCR